MKTTIIILSLSLSLSSDAKSGRFGNDYLSRLCYHNGSPYTSVNVHQLCPEFTPIFVHYHSSHPNYQKNGISGYWTHESVGSFSGHIDHDPGSEFCIITSVVNGSIH